MTQRRSGANRLSPTRMAAALVAPSLVVASCGVDVDFEVSTDRVDVSDSAVPADEEALLASLEGTPHMLWFWAPN